MEEHVHCPLCGREAIRSYSQRWECRGCRAVVWYKSTGTSFAVICGPMIWRDKDGTIPEQCGVVPTSAR